MTDDRINRFVRGELSPAESRVIAQQALDDTELFEELTYSALAKAAVSNRPLPKVAWFPPRARLWAVGAAAAAAMVAAYIYWPARTEKPALIMSAKTGRPLLLARNLQPLTTRSDVFRDAEPNTREPRTIGSIVSIESGMAEIDLGSLDGGAKDGTLDVTRGENTVGRLKITTVFREKARAQVLSGRIQRGDQIRVPPSEHLSALLEQVDALSARGDFVAARTSAEKAVVWAQSESLNAATASERLASLEYQAGMLQQAEQRYQTAGTAEALNAFAVLRMLRGDYAGATQPLREAISKSTRGDIMYARTTNNLGVLAEVRGDLRQAAASYAEASRVFAANSEASNDERQAVEANLARVKGLH